MFKYYKIQEPLTTNQWDFVVEFIASFATRIEVVEPIPSYSERKNRKAISELLLHPPIHFRHLKPDGVTASLRPFLIKNDYISVVFSYDINDGIVNQMRKKWLKKIKNKELNPAFIVFDDEVPIFWDTNLGAVIFLGDGDLPVAESLGMDLMEFESGLNDLVG